MKHFPQFFRVSLTTLVFASVLLLAPGEAVFAKQKKVDSNTATVEELTKVPGITKSWPN